MQLHDIGRRLISILFLCCILSPLAALSAETQPDISVRAAIDIGMSGPKLQVAEIDKKTSKIIRTLHTQRYVVNFYDSLAKSPDHCLSQEIKLQGLQAFKEAVDKALTFNPEGIIAIATAAFRSAENGEDFADELEAETGVKVSIIDQNVEGILAFNAVLAKTAIDPEHLVVWDVGGGSIQFITLSDGEYVIFGIDEGSGQFKDHIIETIQCRNPQECLTPNPMSSRDVTQATVFASELVEEIDPKIFTDKIPRPTTTVVGVGSVFGYGIDGIQHKNPFTLEDLTQVVQTLPGKTDTDFGGGTFAFCEGSNAILVLGIMQTLHIHQVQTLHVNNADGALVFELFW